MAILQVATKTGGGAIQPFVAIDGNAVTLDAQGNGQAPVSGTCGDGSSHVLVITFRGSVGATMGVEVKCGAGTVCEIKESKIKPPRDGWAATHKDFKI